MLINLVLHVDADYAAVNVRNDNIIYYVAGESVRCYLVCRVGMCALIVQ